MTEAFFYGLFMDQDLLREKGSHPSNPRRGYVAGMGLRIGHRATLMHVPDEKTHGIVMTLSDEEISELYAEESVSDYRPEQVTVMLDDGASVEAVCYVLPEHLLSGSNQAYAASLAQVAEKCGLPQDYVARIKRFE